MFFKSLSIPFNRIKKEEARRVIEVDLNETWPTSRFTISNQGLSFRHLCCCRPMVVYKENSMDFSERKIFTCLACATFVYEGGSTRHDILKKQRVQQLKREFPKEWKNYKLCFLDFMADGITFHEFPTFEQFLTNTPLKMKASVQNLLHDAGL